MAKKKLFIREEVTSVKAQSIQEALMNSDFSTAAELYWQQEEELAWLPTTISTEDSSFKSSKKIRIEELLPNKEVDRDFKNLVKGMELTVSRNKTYVYVVAINIKDHRANVGRQITSRQGEPFGGYVYDSEHDSYYIECVEYMDLGFVSCSFTLSIPHIGNWKTAIPLPISVLDDYLNREQMKVLKLFEDKFKSSNFQLQFIQMRGAD